MHAIYLGLKNLISSIMNITFTHVKESVKIFLVIAIIMIGSLAGKVNAQCSSQSYCIPTVSSLNYYYIGIQNVTIGSTINNSTSATGNGPAYSDYTTQSVIATQGATVSFSVQNGSSNSTMIYIFIDYNSDGTFGTSSPELVWTSTNTTASATVTGSFTIPSGQNPGLYRIRVTGDFGGYYSGNPCQLNYGEVEDYSLIVSSSTPNVSAIGVLPTGFAVGNNTIKVKYQNQGSTTINSLSFGYKSTSNGTTVTGSATGLSLTSGATGTYTFGTPLNLTPGTYTLKVWANSPNGVNPDANICGDTMVVTACTGISGSYTIDPSGSGANNYTSFNAAFTALQNCGVSGPVTFSVAAGNYNERLTLSAITGASATNTITFVGSDTSNCRIYNSSSGSSDSWVLQLNGASYCKFRKITFENTSGIYPYTNYYAVWVNNGANANKFDGCKFIAVNGYYYYSVAVGISSNYYYTGTDALNDTITNSRVVGGYIGICYSGNATNTGISITNNKVEKFSSFGISLYPGIGVTCTDNKVFNAYSTSAYGIYLYGQMNFSVERNLIDAPYAGIYMGYSSSLGSKYLVANNMIYGSSTYSSGTFYGIYGYAYGDFINNSIFSSQNGACIYFYGGSSSKLVNNFLISNHQTCYTINTYSAYHSVMDYNDYYTTGTQFALINNSTVADLAALKAAIPGQNAKSISVMPAFINSTTYPFNLHLSSAVASPNADGSYFATIGGVDFDKDARCSFAPTMGADESSYNTGAPVAGFTMPDTIFVNSPVKFLNNNSPNAPLGHQWWIDGTPSGTTLNLGPVTFSSTGPHIIKLKTLGCFGVDSISVTINVYNPTLAPIADFVSDLNIVETYAPVQLTDLSAKGPKYWYWTFTPNNGVNFNNSTTVNSQNPNVSFSNPGLYTVCMWDSNSIGRSSTVCKTNYILVKATNSMCIFPFDTKVASGTLYDDGGPSGPYGNNHTTPCNFLIDPCAASVNLKFSTFNLAANDYLRIYDGKDKFGIPLHSGLGFTGTALPGGIAGLTANSGKMYIEFQTDASTNAAGFAASWSSVAGSFPAPAGVITAPDTAYDCGAPFDWGFQSNDISYPLADPYYKWYFDWVNSNNFPDIEGKGIYNSNLGGGWSYGSTGTYVIKVVMEACGGTYEFFDTIIVDHPASGPSVDFKADLLVATPNDVVNFTDLSKYDPSYWKWTITGPGTVNYVLGNSTSKNPGVKFPVAGTYTVSLMDSNCVGSGTRTKTNYITIINYCLPVVGTLNTDFAVERVMVGRADTIVKGTVLGFDYTNTNPTVGTVSYRDNTAKTATYLIGTTQIIKNVEAVVGLGSSNSFSISRASNFNAANFKVWIDYNQDGSFDPVNELAASSGVTTAKTFTGSFTVPASAKTGYTRMRIGTAFGNLTNTPCGANTFGDFNDFRIKVTADETAPVITFNGGAVNSDYSVTVEVGRTFTDPGFTVTDDVTNPTPYTRSGITNGTVITSHPSTQFYTVTATDAAGNVTIKKLTVNSSADVTKPVISLKGSNPVYVEVGSAYVDSGATASDFYFGNFTSQIATTSNVNTAKTGTYTVSYNVTDSSGNAATTVTRTVIVRDTQKPVITITGGNTMYVDVFSTFNTPAATVSDNYNTGLSYTVTGGPVNTYVLGTYTLFYNAVDSSGNAAATETLTVIVRDVTAPELTMIPPDTMVIDVKTLTQVPEPGYLIRDNYYPNSQITVATQGIVDLNTVGLYAKKYIVSDPSGNVDSSHIRYYNIVDRMAPVITLKGLGIMNWPRWKPFVDPGYTVTDNYDATVNVTVDMSKLNIYLEGVYEITYSATDSHGNKAQDVKRYVNIFTEVNGINKNASQNLFSVYPNPAGGMIHVDISLADAKDASVSIFDANGKLVYLKEGVNTSAVLDIDLSNQANGMYFIRVNSQNYTSSKTFTIQR
jgi:PKD repeat protein